MESQQILVDRLEDELIDHPDAQTRELLQEGNLLDETFQSKLNARADQITHGQDAGGHVNNPEVKDNRNIENDYQFLIEKLYLLYEHTDSEPFETTISEWFTYSDLRLLGIASQPLLDFPYDVAMDTADSLLKCSTAHVHLDVEKLVERGVPSLEFSRIQFSSLRNILYFALGSYNNRQDKNDQIVYMKINLGKLYKWGFLDFLLNYITLFIRQQLDLPQDLSSPPVSQQQLFTVLTTFYLIITALINEVSSFADIRTVLAKHDLLSLIVQFLEFWKVCPNSQYRVRSFILIMWKLLLVEFGDSSKLDSTEQLLNTYHGISTPGTECSNKLLCSPLDYYSFREDIMSKYPLFGSFKDKLHSNSKGNSNADSSSIADESEYDKFMALNENSSSLANLLEVPRTNRSHSMSSQLPCQTVHIATPVPSPPSTPSDFMSGGEKIRKLYQLNQAMPFVYPITSEVRVPYAIQEADDILREAIYESKATKQLWSERQKFMRQERGFVSQYPDVPEEDEFDYTEDLYQKYPERHDEIQSLLRIESFYGKSLVSFNSLVEVLLGTIKVNKYDHDLNFLEWELNDNHFDEDLESEKRVKFIVKQQLEVLRAKEITTKASTNILLLLLQWFEKSHTLKYWYFSCILFDQLFLTVMMEFLNASLANPNLQQANESLSNPEDPKNNEGFDTKRYQNKLLNPAIDLPSFEFFHQCFNDLDDSAKTYELINKIPFLKMPKEIDDSGVSKTFITSFNSNYCSTLTNILSIADLILLDNKTQRILTLSDLKPSNLFKVIVNFNNAYMNKPILLILKKLVPYQGRKWKSNNMELISQIYLHCKLNLRDSWLSGKDLENDFNNSFGQEIALRGLLQFYSLRRYPSQMERMGYELLTENIEAFNLDD